MLTRRLKALVEAGLLERRRYSERPPRDEYVLTERGRDFRPVLWSLLAWGNKHFAPEGRERRSSSTARPARRPTGPGGPGQRPAADAPAFSSVAGPAADERTQLRHGRHRRDSAAAKGAAS